MATLKRLLTRLLVGGNASSSDDGVSALQVAGKSAFSDALTVANVPNQITLVRAAGQQYATIEDNDAQGALRIASYSTAGNAKSISYDSRTDVAGSAVTAGALGHVFLLNGVSQFIVNSSGASLSGNLSVSGTGTFGNTISAAGDVKSIAGTLGVYRYAQAAAPLCGYSAAGTSAAPTAIASATNVANFVGRGYDGTNYQLIGYMGIITDGAVSSSSSPGSLTFNTTPPGSIGSVEAMRVNSAQRLLIGTTTDNGLDKLQINGSVAVTAARLAASTPSAPAAGSALTYGQTFAGRTLAANLPSMGQRAVAQVAQWDRKIGSWISGNAASGGVFSGNFPSLTSVGTITPRTVTPGTMVGMATRLGYASAGTAGSLSGAYATTAQNALGNGSYGGFQFTWRFNFSDPASVSGARAFVGMSSNVAGPANVEPSTLTNSIGLAQLSTDASQLYIVYGGSAAQTAIALGTGFPPMANTGITGGPIYDFTLYSPSSVSGVVYYRLERRDTGTAIEGAVGPGTAGTTLPANTTLLAHRAWRCNNATALAVGIDLHSMYSETEF